MSGIDLLKFDELIKKYEKIISVIKKESANLVNCIKNIDECYEGSSLKPMFSSMSGYKTNLSYFIEILEDYVLYLKKLKQDYIQQDMSVSLQIQKELGKIFDVRDNDG